MKRTLKQRGFDARTVVLVTIVSVLVWLLAESRTVRSQVIELTPSLEVGNESGVLTRAAAGTQWPDSVRVTFSGSAAGLDQVIRSLRGRLLMRVGIEVPASAQTHEIDLREVLRRSDLVAAAGVTVEDVDPPRVLVEVDDVATVMVPVKPLLPDGVQFEPNGSPRANPASIRVTGPRSVVSRLEGAEAEVRVLSGDIGSLQPGRVSTLTGLRFSLPIDADRWATRIEPGQVDLSLTLRSRTAELTLPAMPVQVLLAPGEVGRWRIAPEPGFQDLVGVVVVGPSDQIERLRSGEVVPTAFVSLGFDELERGIESKPAQLQGLPAGVRVSPGQELQVRFRVSRVGEPVGG